MKSETIFLDGSLKTAADALNEIDSFAAKCSLSVKNADTLRLLGEEMMTLITDILEQCEAKFSAEYTDGSFLLHIASAAPIEEKARREFISVSTAHANTEIRGFKKKLSVLFTELMCASNTAAVYDQMMYGYLGEMDPISYQPVDAPAWSLRHYEQNAPKEALDELEGASKSIIGRYADDVIVSVKDFWAEMTVVKKF